MNFFNYNRATSAANQLQYAYKVFQGNNCTIKSALLWIKVRLSACPKQVHTLMFEGDY